MPFCELVLLIEEWRSLRDRKGIDPPPPSPMIFPYTRSILFGWPWFFGFPSRPRVGPSPSRDGICLFKLLANPGALGKKGPQTPLSAVGALLSRFFPSRDTPFCRSNQSPDFGSHYCTVAPESGSANCAAPPPCFNVVPPFYGVFSAANVRHCSPHTSLKGCVSFT